MKLSPRPHLGSYPTVFGCFLLTVFVIGSTAAPSLATEVLTRVKVLETRPAATSGTSELSSFIEPIQQHVVAKFYYPKSSLGNPQGRVSYEPWSIITFVCLEPTRRIVLHANFLWDMYTHVSVTEMETGEYVDIHELLFNRQDDTLYIDMMDNLKANSMYMLMLQPGTHVIDEDDRFGVQAFNYTNEDTGETEFTIGLSSAPNSMRRFIPCFDDPKVKLPYTWLVSVFYGGDSPAIAMLNGKRTSSDHHCPSGVSEHYSRYYFSVPETVVEATQLNVVPFSWYEAEDVPPLTDCNEDWRA